ncbi:AraC family transcriptional regulator [Paenibacillus sp. S150]|uniref:AraC family transcriptional regulator n=1 Tax=Paenibacillus sp. S150 TaxID=2749826 RepID=UPI001C55BCFA|nr:AraC family transcriptional regulator [Paenibacillus sp. S150]MBW4084493.1 AraC family transcriptional regulator [Paenibacillus sp. S150]
MPENTTSQDPVQEQMTELASIIERRTVQDGTHDTAIPALRFIRASRLSEPVYSVYEPSLCIIAQGAKLVMLGQESYCYDQTSYLVSSVHLPIAGQVTAASKDMPYLCLQLSFNSGQILDIIKDSGPSWIARGEAERGLAIHRTGTRLADAALRLAQLLDTPQDIPVLAPLVIREILYRILQDEQGNTIKQFALMGSHAHRIARVIERISHDYAKPLRIEELAAEVNMSLSSLHQHFKEVTALSPLQYQKRLRLQEARKLLLAEATEAADAGFQVGYESPSQFSREYARLFGLPPMSDIKQLRDSLGIVYN